MLRARFRQRNDGSWEQYIEDMSEDSFSFTAQTVESEEDLRSLASQEQELMNIRTGPVFSVVLFSVTNTNTQYILFTAHHLVIDLVSWRVIWHDLEQLLLGNEINPAPSVSFQTWCHLQDEQIKSLHPRDLLPFDLKAPDLEYWGLTIEDNIQDSFMVDQVAFPHALTTDLLEQRNQAVQIAPVDIILGCLLHSFQIAFHDRLVPGVFFEGHGREPLLSNDASEAIDLSGTVGWFTTVHPLQVSMDATTPLLDVIHRVQLVRNNVLGKGQPYFSSTYAASGEQRGFQPHTGVEVLFNYMGAYQQLEAEESLFERYNSQDVPNQVSLTTKRVGLIETSAWVHRGELIFRFERHNRLKKMQDQFDLWMDTFSENLRHATRELQNSSKILFGLQSPSFLNVEQFFIAQGLTVDDIEAAHPCNAIQRHMLEAQAVQGPGIYVISLQFKVNLLPDETSSQRALHSAWDIIVDRYQSLRTIFLRESPFIASQFILRPAAFRRHKSSQNYQVPSGQLPVTHELTVETADSHLLVRLEVNHAIIDRISMDHILNDWQAVYSKNRLPTLYTQLNDAIPEILQLERSEVPSLFWRKTLELVKSPFTVPINSKVRQHSQNACSMTRNFPRLRDMKSAAQIHNATPTSLLYAALATTMSSQLQRDHAGFAAVSMGRSQLSPSSQDCVGPFLTLIPCIVANISMSSSVQILRATHQHMLRASDHERVDIQALGRELGETTPFNILVNYRKFSKPEPKSSAYSCHFQTLASRDLWDFDIVLGVEEIHDELAICLQWYEGRLQRDEAGRWMAALHATLHGYVEDLCLADRI
ncbi:acetyl-CoA synthetase-like protein [Penicillium malachiteum]|uniref:acetyl-CoA synthetase-like protein n=1 Tax=Penicillium malachiteum TaxID=1324776 RepID=UPI0025491F3E|nr:acetyl-CoA synthetase-like protein [Penicillium malachiteum]KAJ5728906.1 acetyl-CoA synthetase-like protein [Penicillium malachiteum]